MSISLGSDGILVGPLPSKKADFGLRILNPDGSEAEKSGNGLRIFARYLKDSGKVHSGLDHVVGHGRNQVQVDRTVLSEGCIGSGNQSCKFHGLYS